MPLNLLVGPANAGKVERLLERFSAELDRHPFLIVPNVGDIGRLQRDLLSRSPSLFAGRVGTFDDLFRELAVGASARSALGDAQRRLLVRSLLDRTKLDSFTRSARFGGFVDALIDGFAELESALIEPGQVEGELGSLYSLYLDRLEQLGLADWVIDPEAMPAGPELARRLASLATDVERRRIGPAVDRARAGFGELDATLRLLRASPRSRSR